MKQGLKRTCNFFLILLRQDPKESHPSSSGIFLPFYFYLAFQQKNGTEFGPTVQAYPVEPEKHVAPLWEWDPGIPHDQFEMDERNYRTGRTTKITNTEIQLRHQN